MPFMVSSCFDDGVLTALAAKLVVGVETVICASLAPDSLVTSVDDGHWYVPG